MIDTICLEIVETLCTITHQFFKFRKGHCFNCTRALFNHLYFFLESVVSHWHGYDYVEHIFAFDTNFFIKNEKQIILQDVAVLTE